jgi:hypothetical protein
MSCKVFELEKGGGLSGNIFTQSRIAKIHNRMPSGPPPQPQHTTQCKILKFAL